MGSVAQRTHVAALPLSIIVAHLHTHPSVHPRIHPRVRAPFAVCMNPASRKPFVLAVGVCLTVVVCVWVRGAACLW